MDVGSSIIGLWFSIDSNQIHRRSKHFSETAQGGMNSRGWRTRNLETTYPASVSTTAVPLALTISMLPEPPIVS